MFRVAMIKENIENFYLTTTECKFGKTTVVEYRVGVDGALKSLNNF